MQAENRASGEARGLIKSPLDFGGGLFLIGLALIGYGGGFSLPVGHLSGIGSGLLPKTVAVLVAAFGVLLIVQSFLFEGPALDRWHLRGPTFILGAALIFAATIRGSTLGYGSLTVTIPELGLIVSGPLCVIVCSFADKDTRIVEVALFSVLMTLICGLLFKEMLNLPIPFDPAGIIPDPINRVYGGAKSALVGVLISIKNLIVR